MLAEAQGGWLLGPLGWALGGEVCVSATLPTHLVVPISKLHSALLPLAQSAAAF